MERSKILIVDDDPAVSRMLARVLDGEGMETFRAVNGRESLRMAKEHSFDLIVLDLTLGDIDGFDVINELRGMGVTTPIFVLSGRLSDHDKVLALGIGADDYVTKPFSTSVFCAKVKACLRRVNISGGKAAVIEAGPFSYVCDEMKLLKNGSEILLSSKESFMMKYFLRNINKVLTKEQIYLNVWEEHIVDDNTIMVYIRRLRTKIEDDPNQPLYLKTVRGVGYQFCANDE